MRNALTIAAATTALLLTLMPVGAQTTKDAHEDQVVVSMCPEGIMDTDVELTVIVAPGQEELGQKALKAGEAALRGVEAKMSSHLADTEIAAINKAEVDKEVPLSPEVVEVLRTSQAYTKATDGSFDVTIRPLLQLWKRAGKAKRLPTDAELAEARGQVGWANFKLGDKGITKLKDGASIDLGGIAKKWGIDEAADAMIKTGVSGGLVNVGGDLRLFGEPKGHGKWQVGIKNPFEKDELVATMSIKDGAVCTSGNYERFVTIDGKRYSHIVDARTGQPANAVPSVTVYGKTAVESGIWGTALSMLGPEGLKLMPKDLDAMLVVGAPGNYKFHYSDGFKKLLNELPEAPLPPLPTASAPAK